MKAGVAGWEAAAAIAAKLIGFLYDPEVSLYSFLDILHFLSSSDKILRPKAPVSRSINQCSSAKR